MGKRKDLSQELVEQSGPVKKKKKLITKNSTAEDQVFKKKNHKETPLITKLPEEQFIKKRKNTDASVKSDVFTGNEDSIDTSKQHENKKNTFEKTGNKSSISKKHDWLKLKEKKKALKVERKKKKALFDLGVRSKQLWEQLRRKSCSKEKKTELVKELHILLKGNYAKAVFSHDIGRVVQWLLKTGTKEVCDDIAKELKGHFVEMAQSKYGCFCVKQLMKRGSKEIKMVVINSLMGNVVKLMSHRVSSPVISNIYSTYANSLQKCHMRQEFYSEIYRVMKNDGVKNLNLALEMSKDMKEAVLKTTKSNLVKVINKELVESQLVNTVLGEFISLCDDPDRSEIISSINSFLPLLAQTKEGAKVGMMCAWHGTQKDRKVVIKSLKGSIPQIAMSEHGHLVLLSLFDCVDDTVLVKKAIISEILSNVLDLVKNKFGRKVILYLVAPRDPLYFHPDIVEMLQLGDGNVHSKKPVDVRRDELRAALSEPVLDLISKEVSEWFSDNSVGMVALAILTAGRGAKLNDVFKTVALYMCSSIEAVKDEDGKDSSIILEDGGMHIILKKLILYDEVRYKENNDALLFSEVFLSELDDATLSRVISSNRGCFTILELFKINNPKINKLVKQMLMGKLVEIAKLKFKGAELLKSKLRE